MLEIVARADEVVRLAREVMHRRAHTGELLNAMAAYEKARRQPAPNDQWCVGCDPDNCSGCGPLDA